MDRKLKIEKNDSFFHAEFPRSGEGKVPLLKPAEFPLLPSTAFVLTGRNTPEYGGQQSSTGYIVTKLGQPATHSVSLEREHLQENKFWFLKR